jgi:hypothetical protein
MPTIFSPEVVTAVRQVYDGPVDFAVDGMTWNITREGVRTHVAMLNSQPFEFQLKSMAPEEQGN